MKLNNFQRIFVIALVCYCYILWAPLVGYNVRRLWKHRTKQAFLKRHPYHVIAFYTVVVVHVFIEQPSALLSLLFHDEMESHTWTYVFAGIKFFEVIAFILIFLSRCWLLYYDYRVNDAIANLEWRLHIQPTYKEDNWWILKKNTWGNPSYSATVATIIWFLAIIIFCIIFGLFGEFKSQDLEAISLFVFALFFTPIGIAWCTIIFKIRDINDVFNIRKEMKFSFLSITIAFLLYGGVILASVIIQKSYLLDDPPVQCSLAIITITCAGIVAVINAYYIAVEPNRKYDRDDTLLEKIPPLDLRDILSTRVGFEIFMKHLVGEFSVESLLFVSEVQKYRSTLHYTPNEDELLQLQQLSIVPTLDLSWLPLAPALSVDDPRFRAAYIYSKYICKTANHQVNISSHTWKEITSYFPEFTQLNEPNNKSLQNKYDTNTKNTKNTKPLRKSTNIQSRVFPNRLRSYSGKLSTKRTNHNAKKSYNAEYGPSDPIIPITASHQPIHRENELDDNEDIPIDVSVTNESEMTTITSNGSNKTAITNSTNSNSNSNTKTNSDSNSGTNASVTDNSINKNGQNNDHYQISVQSFASITPSGSNADETASGYVSPTPIQQHLSKRKKRNRRKHEKAQSLYLDTNKLNQINNKHGYKHSIELSATSSYSNLSASRGTSGTMLEISDEDIREKAEFYHLYDDAEKEVWRLMKDSLIRFQQTDAYDRLAIQFAIKNKSVNTFGNDGNDDNNGNGNNSYGNGKMGKGLTRVASLFQSMKLTMSISSNVGDMKQPLLTQNRPHIQNHSGNMFFTAIEASDDEVDDSENSNNSDDNGDDNASDDEIHDPKESIAL